MYIWVRAKSKICSRVLWNSWDTGKDVLFTNFPNQFIAPSLPIMFEFHQKVPVTPRQRQRDLVYGVPLCEKSSLAPPHHNLEFDHKRENIFERIKEMKKRGKMLSDCFKSNGE
ncbi:hypothetical protein AVEN_271324-1 [Araneus ventricosus]|uniref:Uncharacterized protein n=1 Tax=Araneus ventricosus TaxID=182803 RepID=A0A4Y2W6X5_ARAVE|nr:hypothetical protein AVEN_271324-1 [Araneus ventricosus]